MPDSVPPCRYPGCLGHNDADGKTRLELLYEHGIGGIAAEVIDRLSRGCGEHPGVPGYRHPDCGFCWHGKNGLDVPVSAPPREPICPRCTLVKVREWIGQQYSEYPDLEAILDGTADTQTPPGEAVRERTGPGTAEAHKTAPGGAERRSGDSGATETADG